MKMELKQEKARVFGIHVRFDDFGRRDDDNDDFGD